MATSVNYAFYDVSAGAKKGSTGGQDAILQLLSFKLPAVAANANTGIFYTHTGTGTIETIHSYSIFDTLTANQLGLYTSAYTDGAVINNNTAITISDDKKSLTLGVGAAGMPIRAGMLLNIMLVIKAF